MTFSIWRKGNKSFPLLLFLCCLVGSRTSSCGSDKEAITVRIQTGDSTGTKQWHLFNLQQTTNILSSDLIIGSHSSTTMECIAKAEKSQYILTFSSKWGSGDIFEIYGDDDVLLFKYPQSGTKFQLSLYRPITPSDLWDWRCDYEEHWMKENSVGWDVDSSAISVSSFSFYFRRPIECINEMAAYEARFYYKDGIVVYLGGVEIFRDNLSNGPILPNAAPTNTYSQYDYRGTIRNGYECSQNQMVYVEIHNRQKETTQFNAWFALYASSLETFYGQSTSCYPLPVKDITTTYSGASARDVYDDDYENTFLYVEHFGSEYIEFTYPTAQLNAYTIFHSSDYGAITSFNLSSPSLLSNHTRVSFITPTTMIEKYSLSILADHHLPNAQSTRFCPADATHLPSQIFELHPYVCSFAYAQTLTALAFRPAYLLGVGRYERIQPSNAMLFECVLGSPLPVGMTLNGCIIEGTPVEIQSSTSVLLYYWDVLGTRHIVIQLEVMKTVIPFLGTNYSIREVCIFVLGVVVTAGLLVFCCYYIAQRFHVKKPDQTGKQDVKRKSPIPSSSNTSNPQSSQGSKEVEMQQINHAMSSGNPPSPSPSPASSSSLHPTGPENPHQATISSTHSPHSQHRTGYEDPSTFHTGNSPSYFNTPNPYPVGSSTFKPNKRRAAIMSSEFVKKEQHDSKTRSLHEGHSEGHSPNEDAGSSDRGEGGFPLSHNIPSPHRTTNVLSSNPSHPPPSSSSLQNNKPTNPSAELPPASLPPSNGTIPVSALSLQHSKWKRPVFSAN